MRRVHLRGDVVKGLRQSLELSQKELGEAAGISRDHVANVELDRRGVSLGVAEDIAKALDIDLERIRA